MSLKNKVKLFTNFGPEYKKLSRYIKGNKKPFFFLIFLESIVYTIGIVLAILSKNVIDNVIDNNMRLFGYFVIAYGFLAFLGLGLNSYLSYFKSRFNLKLTNHIQKNFFKSYCTQDWFDVSHYHSGDVVTRITKDVSSIVAFFTSIAPSVIALVIQLAIAFAVAVNYDKTLGIFGFATLPIIVIISLVFGDKMKKQQREINQKEGQYRAFINESIQNILVIKTFQNEPSKIKRLMKLQGQKFNLIIRKTKIVVYSAAVIDIGYTISSVIAFTWGTYRISQGIITFGMFTAIMQLLSRMQSPIAQLSRLLPQYISSTAAVERCEPFETFDKELCQLKPCKHYPLALGLKVNHVSFAYNTSKENVIDDLSFDIKPGSKVAIIGKSGVGKTTLLKVIMDLYKPKNGAITAYNSEENHDNSPDFYSYVPQGNTLFSGTIKSNLLLAKSDASDEEIMLALDHACALDFIRELPLTLDTPLGEQGNGLSEGQLQRICVARSLLRQAPVLLLDEATSALDQKTEAELIHRIYLNYPHKTVIAITHRPAILDFVDYTIELSK